MSDKTVEKPAKKPEKVYANVVKFDYKSREYVGEYDNKTNRHFFTIDETWPEGAVKFIYSHRVAV